MRYLFVFIMITRRRLCDFLAVLKYVLVGFSGTFASFYVQMEVQYGVGESIAYLVPVDEDEAFS